MKQAKAGWTTVEITPPLGLPMGGRGARFTPGASIHDPLYGQVLLLEDTAGVRLAVVSLDLIGISLELGHWLRWAVSSATGARPEAVLVNCSHTHSGPMAHWSTLATLAVKPPQLLEYEQELFFKIQRSAALAAGNLKPAEIRWHEGTCHVGINRRRMVDGKMQMGPNPEGAYNRQMVVIDIQSGKDRAVLFNHGCHPVIVYGYCWDAISADWPGRARELIRQSLGKAVHAQFLQGFAGDVRPRALADLHQNQFRNSTPADVQAAGHEAAQSVLEALNDRGEAVVAKLSAAQTHIMLSTQPGEPAETWRAKMVDQDELEQNTARYWFKRLSDGGSPTLHIPWMAGLAKLDDDHALAWIAGEPLSEWLQLLKQTIPSRRLAGLGYTNNSQNYLPRDKHLLEGGYEITISRQYCVDGPGNFNPGMDAAMEKAFGRMERAMSLS